jgi:secreted Zn-dependent insulinase-like peptidase
MNLIQELEREKAHGDTMTAAAELWMEKAKDAEHKLAIAVLAAGCEIVVRREHMEDADRIELVTMERHDDMTIRLRAMVR